MVYKNNKLFVTRDMLVNVVTYDQLVQGDNRTYQDVINNDKVTQSLMKLDNSGLSYRCDYITYLMEYYYRPGETGNHYSAMLYCYPETREDFLCGYSCYLDILHHMMRKSNRKDIDKGLLEGLEYWGKDYRFKQEEKLRNALGCDDQIELEASRHFGSLYSYTNEGVALDEATILNRSDSQGLNQEKEISVYSEQEQRDITFLKSLPEEERFMFTKWFAEGDIRNFIEENFLEATNDTEKRIDEILHQIWEADESTLDYYYSFPKSWEENVLAQLVRNKVGVPLR